MNAVYAAPLYDLVFIIIPLLRHVLVLLNHHQPIYLQFHEKFYTHNRSVFFNLLTFFIMCYFIVALILVLMVCSGPVIDVSSKGPNRVGVVPPLTSRWKQIQFSNRCVF
jgi:hypothetical protein